MLKSKFVSDILTLLLDADDAVDALQHQLAFLEEDDLEYTTRGVIIAFKQLPGIEAYRCAADGYYPGVTIKSTELEVGADATLVVDNGLIDYLEIWAFGGVYPSHELKQYELEQVWQNSPGRKVSSEDSK
ncbi:hypothetical protein F0P96_08615 [Hymenobacter busanensis]|uniref:Uncharacterized protein n=1 Tax=Hymenobacter busanensis TaxID=2607656 RepID=A0A7L4ZYI7_9BACT|nr:hypothetical protein [Hymenobacter busanensis]KAA9333037.1 hypothetical protein F0P96_08615 [Hymenobacter busanensis]QHJ08288.1 hypothetical protein GUY19_13710 [Hymenobacter busanensis]